MTKLSSSCYIRCAPQDVGMFRFLLEAYEHIGYFTVIDRHTALLKIVYTQSMKKSLERALCEISETVPIERVCVYTE